MAALRIAHARTIERHCIADARKGSEAHWLQCGHPRDQRILALEQWRWAEVWSRLPASSHRTIKRTGESAAHIYRRASQAACELEAEAQTFQQRRLHLLTLLLLDTGCRITEALTLRVCDVDLDNMLLTVDGKGRKQRIIPFSFGLRKALHRFITDFDRKPDYLLFATRENRSVRRMTALRAVKVLCARLGFDAPPRTLHAFRHTFAVNYLRRGGSVFHLQKCLGHSSLEMTRRYANLMTEDLQAVHERVSLLSLR
jgi:site-specific recombinase XerD